MSKALVEPAPEDHELTDMILVAKSRRLRSQLYPVPILDIFAQYLIHQSVLFDDWQALELVRCYCHGIHTSAATTDIFDLCILLDWMPMHVR